MKKAKIANIGMIAATLFAGASAQADVGRLWLMYRLPTNQDLVYEARRLEANALSQRNVEIQACANGNDSAACNVSAEIAFRRRILAIPQVRFSVYYNTEEMGLQSQWLLDLTSKEAVDRKLNQLFSHLEPEAPGDMDLQIDTDDCSFFRYSDRRTFSYPYPDFTNTVCKIVVARSSAAAYLWSQIANKSLAPIAADDVDFFFKHGVSIGQRNVDEVTLLMAASLRGMTDVAKLLIRLGADINTKDNTGTTALGYAASNGSPDIAKLLVNKGADVNVWQDTERGTTALMMAASNGHTEMVRYLISEGATVDARERWGGCSALNLAVKDNHLEAVKMLLDHKAETDFMCFGETALKYAVSEGYTDIADVLREHGADDGEDHRL